MAFATPNGTKANPEERKQILNFLKELLPKYLVDQIADLLHPCCIPDIQFDKFECNWDGNVWGVLLTGVVISAPVLANKQVLVILEATEQTGGVLQDVPLDSKGEWKGNLKSSWGASLSTLTVVGGLQDKRIFYPFPTKTLTGVPNCD